MNVSNEFPDIPHDFNKGGCILPFKMDRTRGDNKNSLKFPSQEKNGFPSLDCGSLFLQRFGKIRQLL